MGMKGPQFALIRRLMIQHLTGNSGWRFGAPPKKMPEQTDAPEPDGPAGEDVPAADEAAPTNEPTEVPDDEDGRSPAADPGTVTEEAATPEPEVIVDAEGGEAQHEQLSEQ